MAEKKEAECCGRTLAHKKDGMPYEHACTRKDVRPEDPFHVPGRQRPATRTCACGEITTKGPFPGRHEAKECGESAKDMAARLSQRERLISTDGEDLTEAYSPQEPFTDDPFESPTVTEQPPHTFETAPLEPTGDHRKWCTRCKLLGHYAADCTTAVLEGGVVTFPSGATLSGLDQLTEPDPFTTPTQTAEKVNVSGQPAARYEWYGKQNRGYLVKLPETGDFRRYGNGKPKGLTRATTFNKAATDQNSLTDWAKRNVLIGASLRPDLVAKAHGLTHEDNRDQLMKLVAELETTAGAKVSADVGTLIHELTERWDAGVITIDDVPQAYKELIRLYQDKLNQYGLRPFPGLIERTTYIPEFGGVVGTLDRVYYHERSGQYVIGDVKTGKTLKYGMDEIETQEWIYAHGVNNAGVYDWNTDEWQFAHDGCECVNHGSGEDCKGPRYVKVSEDWGVVVHMPVQGEDAGKVMLVQANLQRGKRHAEVCHQVRLQRATKPKPEPWTGEELGARETAPLSLSPSLAQLREDAFRCVTSKAHAAQLWQSAYDAGAPPEEMERLKEIADARLAELKELDQPLTWVEQAERVLTKEDAADVWQRASAAGVQGPELDSLVAIMQRELS